MKPSLFILGILLFASCEKKSIPTGCYYCVSNDSLSSNIPLLANSHYKGSSGYHCDINEAQKDFLVKQGTYSDTFFYRHDTVQINNWTMSCTKSE
jgi:hypothetical protein